MAVERSELSAATVAESRPLRCSDALIRSILDSVRTIAIVGASANPTRPSFIAAKYLSGRNYDIWCVNPGLAGQTLLGKPVAPTLADVPVQIDLVDIFRKAQAAYGVTAEALSLTPLPKVIWMQLGVRNDEAAALAEAKGVTVIMNRCPKIEYGRLSGEIGWTGVNSRVLSSKRRVLVQGTQKLGLRPANKYRPPQG